MLPETFTSCEGAGPFGFFERPPANKFESSHREITAEGSARILELSFPETEAPDVLLSALCDDNSEISCPASLELEISWREIIWVNEMHVHWNSVSHPKSF
jgi:hypothetical protein